MTLSCRDIATAAGLQPAKTVGDEIYYHCTNHEDNHPSLKIHSVKNCWGCFPCGASGNPWQLAAFLAQLDPDNKPSVTAWLRTRSLLPTTGSNRQVVTEYDYTDEAGNLLYQNVRYDPKDFRQRRPDGKGGWIWNLHDIQRVLYNLPAILQERSVLFVEGEKDCETANGLGLVATTSGAVGTWRPEFAEVFRGKRVAIVQDGDEPGRKHGRTVARCLVGVASAVKLQEMPGAKDLSEWVERGGGKESLLEILRAVPELTAKDVVAWKDIGATTQRKPSSRWSSAQAAPDFLSTAEAEVEWLKEPLLAPGSITEFFSPRGIGKTHIAHALVVDQARRCKLVLFLDRDNSRREVKRRLRGWGAGSIDASTLKIMTRDIAPPLTDAAAWADFPFGDYDLLVIDSLDSSAEGVGEKDSSKPSRAIAPLLDIAHRADGPAILVLGNTIKSGENSRGSGVVEDRADICYEIRDATGLQPSGKKPWWEELPPAAAAAWAERATRRKRRDSYRLAFVPSKFRVGEEPDPFIFEIDLSGDTWTMRDVTTEVEGEGTQTRDRDQKEREDRLEKAAKALIEEVQRRAEQNNPMLSDKEGVPFLVGYDLKRAEARQLLKDRENQDWRTTTLNDRKGNPKVLFPVERSHTPNGGESGVAAAGISQSKTPNLSIGSNTLISADPMDIERRESAASVPLLNKGSGDMGSFPPSFSSSHPVESQGTENLPPGAAESVGIQGQAEPDWEEV